ncbi:MAG: FKBP-type peptidyl-prolyl cis-trans isomerase [Prevotellaceae bacterium]|jgi:FKBP-type peptidyl-prolyl cis-trans isomerase SlyD|nr:FKBP-type peptidyl-prolyl cis-trans isomerase [Prevotellaceae bacterium]
MKVEQNKVVSLSYRLEANGNVIEEVTKEKPVQFMYGVGYLLPKFEKQIENMSTGDKFDFILQALEAYGEIDEEAILDLPKNVFEIDGKFDDKYIKTGESIPMQDQEGNRLYGVVEKVGDSMVTMNFNHPLAGNTLHFAGEIVDVREATPEDLSGSCGCGCGCDCDDNCECEDNNCGCGCNC